MVVLQLDFNYRMFVPLVVLLTLLILFLRQSYKYRDTKFLFLAFVSLVIGTLFAFLEPGDAYAKQVTVFLEHAFGAAFTGWLLAMDTHYLAQLKRKA